MVNYKQTITHAHTEIERHTDAHIYREKEDEVDASKFSRELSSFRKRGRERAKETKLHSPFGARAKKVRFMVFQRAYRNR